MKRHLGLIVICLFSAFAVGCESAYEDEGEVLSMSTSADIEAPINEPSGDDYLAYSEGLRIKSPVAPAPQAVDTTSNDYSPAQTHFAGNNQPPKHAN